MSLPCPRCQTVDGLGPDEAVCGCISVSKDGGRGAGTMTKRKLDVTVRRPPLGSDLPPGIRDLIEGGAGDGCPPDPEAGAPGIPSAAVRGRDLMHAQEAIGDTLGRAGHGMVLTDRRVHATIGGTSWCADLQDIRSVRVGLRRRPIRIVTGATAIAGGAIGIMSAMTAWLLGAGPWPLVAAVGLASIGTLLGGVHRASSEAMVIDMDVAGRNWSIDLGATPMARGHAFAVNVLMAKDLCDDRHNDRRNHRRDGSVRPTAAADRGHAATGRGRRHRPLPRPR